MTNEHQSNEPSLSNEPQHQDRNAAGNAAFTPMANHESVPPAKLKHSGPGIASFIIALLAVLALVIGVILSVVAVANSTDFIGATPEEIEEQLLSGGGGDAASLIGAGLLMMLSIGIAIIGLILAIIGVVMKNRKKVFAIIGLILNGLMVLSVIVLMAIGLMAA
ncbi:hypothetical protein [Paenibacillus sp. PL2-23]|uniref:hypothetical protein n=1 Tax=Paenibacillus sp. PL2-23 TaxID=2100729 RepID=UPI0030F9C90E